MRLSLIVAAAENGVIGRHGRMPWRLSADLQRFKQLTMGHAIIMGRRTFESIGRRLPGRRSIVMSRRQDFDAQGAGVAANLDEALQLAAGDTEAFVIGGAEIYALAIPLAGRIYMTVVHARPAGDTRFPAWSQRDWTLLQDDRFAANERNQYDYSFRVFERNPPVPAAPPDNLAQ